MDNGIRGRRILPITENHNTMVNPLQRNHDWKHFHVWPGLHCPEVKVHVVTRIALHAQSVDWDAKSLRRENFLLAALHEDS